MNDLRRSRRLGVGLVSLSMLLVACSAAASPPTSAPSSPPPDAPVSAPPSDPSGGGTDPGAGDGDLVVPKPGQLDVRDVPADKLVARVDGSTIIVTVNWTSGVEPCFVLDQVAVTEGPGTYAITLREGRGPEEVACIAMAQLKKTEVSIPTDGPGTYQITDGAGGAAPIEVTVS